MNINISHFRLILSLLLVMAATFAGAQDYRQPLDSLHRQDSIIYPDRYIQRISNREDRWLNLIPNQYVLQYAGNMGLMSFGIGWTYGKREQWESDLLFGFLPKYNSERFHMTFTLKENYIPWSIDFRHGWELKPFTSSIYLNFISGHEFWNSQPRSRYPDGYYGPLSTKLRYNISFGQRVEKHIPHNHRKYFKAFIFFYEVSTCDLYVRSMFMDGFEQPLRDVVTLSLGLRMRIQ